MAQIASLMTRVQGTLSGVSLRLRRPGYVTNVLLVAGGTAAAQALVVLTSPILTRIYRPGDFGVLSVFLSILSPLTVIAALRYELAIPLAQDDADAADVLALGALMVLATTLFSAAAVCLLGGWIVVWLDGQISASSLWLVPLALLCAGYHQTASSWLVRKKAFPHVAVGKLSQGVGQTAGQIVFGLLGLGPLGLVIGVVIGRASGLGWMTRKVWHSGKSVLPRVSLPGMCRAAARYRRFPLISSWAAFLNAVGLWLPSVLIAAFYDLQVVGWLALAQRVMGIPVTLVSGSVSSVYLAECARLNHEDPHKLLGLFWKTLKAQSWVALALAAIVVVPAPWLFGVIFGRDWAESGRYLLALSFLFVPKFVAFPLASTLDVMERQDLHLARESLRIVVVVAAVASGAALGCGALTTVFLLSVAVGLTYCVGIVAVWYSIKKRVEYAEGKLSDE